MTFYYVVGKRSGDTEKGLDVGGRLAYNGARIFPYYRKYRWDAWPVSYSKYGKFSP